MMIHSLKLFFVLQLIVYKFGDSQVEFEQCAFGHYLTTIETIEVSNHQSNITSISFFCSYFLRHPCFKTCTYNNCNCTNLPYLTISDMIFSKIIDYLQRNR